MLKRSLFVLTLAFASSSHGAEPAIDNDRVAVWDTPSALPPAQHDFVAITLSGKSAVKYGHSGDTPNKVGVRTVVIELKDNSPAPIVNNSGYPLAFPRPDANKLLENDRVIVWDNVWRPGRSTPMHFHDKDAIVVFESNGALQSTDPDGKSFISTVKSGDIRFNRRDRTHREILVSGHAHAIIVELK